MTGENKEIVVRGGHSCLGCLAALILASILVPVIPFVWGAIMATFQ